MQLISWGHILQLHVVMILIFAALALELVVGKIHYTRTLERSNIWVTTVYLPQTSPGTHLLTITKGMMTSCVNCKMTAQGKISTWACSFLASIIIHHRGVQYNMNLRKRIVMKSIQLYLFGGNYLHGFKTS